MTRANAKWIRLMAVIGCTTMWMASCKHAPDAQMKASYATMKVSTANKELTTPYSATIRGRQDIDIYPQVSGTIERLCVTEGEVVRKGQLLFVIDQVPYKAALKTAQANVEVAKAALATAELNYNSTKELFAKKVVSAFNLKTSENSYLTAKAQLAQAEAQEVNAIIRKTKCFDFWERNVLFPKTKRSFFRTPTPLPCPFPLNFSLLIITKKFGNFAKNRYICIV